jgi:hypothetical protein
VNDIVADGLRDSDRLRVGVSDGDGLTLALLVGVSDKVNDADQVCDVDSEAESVDVRVLLEMTDPDADIVPVVEAVIEDVAVKDTLCVGDGVAVTVPVLVLDRDSVAVGVDDGVVGVMSTSHMYPVAPEKYQSSIPPEEA